MLLERLTEENISNISAKRVICFEKSDSYLQEMQAEFSVALNIIAVVDDFKRNQKVFSFYEKEISVVGSSYLENFDFSDTAIVITSDYYKEAYEKLCSIQSIVTQVDVIYFFANKETAIELEYRQRYSCCDLENIIVFRSGPHASSYVQGMDFADNARALFEYMLENKYNEKYDLVWIVKNPNEFKKYENIKNVKFISFEWSYSENIAELNEYYRVLCLAKYFFFTDAYGFVRNCRKDQVRIQLWHGCGFKTRVNFVSCRKRYEYTTVISDLYADIHSKVYDLDAKQMKVTGYAKHDWLYKPVSDELLHKLNIPKSKKYIFWLPTFRTTKENLSQLNEEQLLTETGLPILNSRQEMLFVDNILHENDVTLVIKLHPYQLRDMIHCDGFRNIVLVENEQLLEVDISINQLLARADALISDYSSAAVDFLSLDRPIAFTLDDMEEYGKSRGFQFENIQDWLPGVELYNYDDFMCFLKSVLENKDLSCEKRKQIRSKMLKFFDGNNSKRICETFLPQ